MHPILRTIACLTVSMPCGPLLAATAPNSACIDLTKTHSTAKLAGKLTIQLFAGAPNYESIAEGDAEERVFILELSERACANDQDFITPEMPFDRVQVSSADDQTMSILRSAVGRNVTVQGEAFGAHTGHHHAPLVMLADEVTVHVRRD